MAARFRDREPGGSREAPEPISHGGDWPAKDPNRFFETGTLGQLPDVHSASTRFTLSAFHPSRPYGPGFCGLQGFHVRLLAVMNARRAPELHS